MISADINVTGGHGLKRALDRVLEACMARATQQVTAALNQHAMELAGKTKETLAAKVEGGISPPGTDHSEYTTARKDHDKWLHDTGTFIQGLTPVKTGDGGGLRAAWGLRPDSPPSADNKLPGEALLEVQTKGAVINVTDPEKIAAMMGWLRRHGVLDKVQRGVSRSKEISPASAGIVIVVPPHSRLVRPDLLSQSDIEDLARGAQMLTVDKIVSRVMKLKAMKAA